MVSRIACAGQAKAHCLKSQALRLLLDAFPGSVVEATIERPEHKGEDTVSLLDDLAIDYTQWRPADNPDQPRGIEGILKDRQVWQSDFGTFDMLFLVTDENVAWSWAGLGAIASKEVGRRDPQPGDRIAIAYKGELENKIGDKPMQVFRMLTVPGPRHSATYRPPTPIPTASTQQMLGEGEEPF